MKVVFERSFLSDIRNTTDKSILSRLSKIIQVMKAAHSLDDIPNLKKLKGHPAAFRIKLNQYRVGFFLENDMLILVRFRNRKDIYKGFPD
jgi:mRNA interferase RelE/StbE